MSEHKDLPTLQRAAAAAAGIDIREAFALDEQMDAAHEAALEEDGLRSPKVVTFDVFRRIRLSEEDWIRTDLTPWPKRRQ